MTEYHIGLLIGDAFFGLLINLESKTDISQYKEELLKKVLLCLSNSSIYALSTYSSLNLNLTNIKSTPQVEAMRDEIVMKLPPSALDNFPSKIFPSSYDSSYKIDYSIIYPILKFIATVVELAHGDNYINWNLCPHLSEPGFASVFEIAVIEGAHNHTTKSKTLTLKTILLSLLHKSFNFQYLFINLVNNIYLNQHVYLTIEINDCSWYTDIVNLATIQYPDILEKLFDLETLNYHDFSNHDIGFVLSEICSSSHMDLFYNNASFDACTMDHLKSALIKSETPFLNILLTTYLNFFSNSAEINKSLVDCIARLMLVINFQEYPKFKSITRFLYLSYTSYLEVTSSFAGPMLPIEPNAVFRDKTENLYYFRKIRMLTKLVLSNMNRFVFFLLYMYNVTLLKNIKYDPKIADELRLF